MLNNNNNMLIGLLGGALVKFKGLIVRVELEGAVENAKQASIETGSKTHGVFVNKPSPVYS